MSQTTIGLPDATLFLQQVRVVMTTGQLFCQLSDIKF